MDLTFGYWNQAVDSASVENFQGHREEPTAGLVPDLISEETLIENKTSLDFKGFIREYPDKIIKLLDQMRPEFKELFIEYYLLEKSQSFLGKVHGQIQTRIWQNLRLIEQALGALIVLGNKPTAEALRPTLQEMALEETPLGSLADLIAAYARTRSYRAVAKRIGAPTPAVRKVFRPAIKILLAAPKLKAISIGAYLRNLTHQASLTDAGLSKRYTARLKKLTDLEFDAPEAINGSFVRRGRQNLKQTPWNMFEIKTDWPALKVLDTIYRSLDKIFRDHTVEIFAPLDEKNNLRFGYIFVRCSNPKIVHNLNRVAFAGHGGRRGDTGILEMSAAYDDVGNISHAIQIPDEDVQKMRKASPTEQASVEIGNFVEILTGEASHYCGYVKSVGTAVEVHIEFPSGRKFIVQAHPSSVRVLRGRGPRNFWGIQSGEIS